MGKSGKAEAWHLPRTQGVHLTTDELDLVKKGLAEKRAPFEVAREIGCTIAAVRWWYTRWDGRKWYAHGPKIDRRVGRDRGYSKPAEPLKPKVKLEPNLYRSNFEPT